MPKIRFALPALLGLAAGSCHLFVSLDDLQSGEAPDAAAPIACPDQPEVSGAELHVATTGDDAAAGTAAAPWRSVGHAAAAAQLGDVIRVGPGRFEEAATVNLPSGVSLIGAGADQTTLASLSADAVVRILGAQTATVSRLTIEGRNRSTAEGLVVEGGSGLTLASLAFDGFGKSALRLLAPTAPISGLEICGATFTRCGSLDPASLPYVDTACIRSEAIQGSVLRQVSIDEDAGPGITIDSVAGGTLVEDVTLQDVQVSVPRLGSNGGGFAPQYTVALRDVAPRNLVVESCSFDNPLVIWQTWDIGVRAVRVHHSTFTPQTYAIEIDVPSLEFDHNTVVGGYYAIFNLNTTAQVPGVRVHHNLFLDQSEPTLIAEVTPVFDGFLFYNNTVHVTPAAAAAPLFVFQGGGAGQAFRNNVFLSENTQPNPLGVPVDALVDHNLFWGLPAPAGGENLEVDPDLDSHYVPAATSPVVGAGVALEGMTGPVNIGACDPGAAICP